MKRVGDITKPHLHKKFKTVPMRDEKGNVIPDNPPLQHGGPWAKPVHGIKIGETNSSSK